MMVLSKRHNVGSTFIKKKCNVFLAVVGSALLMRSFWERKLIIL